LKASTNLVLTLSQYVPVNKFDLLDTTDGSAIISDLFAQRTGLPIQLSASLQINVLMQPMPEYE